MFERSAPALVDLRKTLRKRRLEDQDRFEAFYRVYITGLLVGLLLFLGSTRIADAPISEVEAALVLDHGAAVAGLLVALASAAGMRSGAGGGPLAIEAAEARYTLEAPIPRSEALRGPLLRKLRFAAYSGAIAGAAAGLLAHQRLAGPLWSWVVSWALFGLLISLAWHASALIFSGRRIESTTATLVGLLFVAFACADVFAGTRLSPSTQVGRIALWPFNFDPMGLVGLAEVVAVTLAGMAAASGTSIEAAQRRSRLVSGQRVAALLFDVRTVVLIRRELAHESARSEPWIRLRPSERSRVPIWKRDWHGLFRSPLRRMGRVLILGALAGVSLAGFWNGTTALILLAGGLLYLAALDLIDPLGQETDHATFHESFPWPVGRLYMRHLPASVLAMLPVTATTQAICFLATGALSWADLVVIAIISAMSTVSGAAISITMTELPLMRAMQALVPQELMGMRVLVSMAIPPLMATLGLLPVLVAREFGNGAPVFWSAAIASIILLARLLMLRYREEVLSGTRGYVRLG